MMSFRYYLLSVVLIAGAFSSETLAQEEASPVEKMLENHRESLRHRVDVLDRKLDELMIMQRLADISSI